MTAGCDRSESSIKFESIRFQRDRAVIVFGMKRTSEASPNPPLPPVSAGDDGVNIGGEERHEYKKYAYEVYITIGVSAKQLSYILRFRCQANRTNEPTESTAIHSQTNVVVPCERNVT